VGVGRRPWTNDIFRENVEKSLENDSVSKENIAAFTSHFYYHPFDVTEPSSYQALGTLISELENKYQTDGNRIFYLAMAPEYLGNTKELNNEIRAAFSEEQIYRIDHYLGKEMVQNIEVIRFANGIFEHLWNNRFISNIQVTSSESLGVEERARYYDHSGATRD